jgi:membrane protein YdbS with pleckstrin-like domain
MTGWRAFVLQLMRVSQHPSLPPGSRPRVFRASQRYFSFRVLTWWIGQIFFLLLVIAADLIAANVARSGTPAAAMVVRVVFVVTFLGLILRTTLGYAILKLDYELRWYMISDRAIRIREGIVTVREKTIALANIQNTVVRQGPLQRLFRIADVEVTTAGGGGGATQQKGQQNTLTEPMHVGVFRGVDNAQEIRSVILEGVRRHRGTGLGDSDEMHAEDGAVELLREVRMTREMLERSVSS